MMVNRLWVTSAWVLLALTLLVSLDALGNPHLNTRAIIIAVVDDGFNTEHWDVSDQDANLMVPAARFEDLDHGTFIAGIIAQTVREHLGTMVDYPIKLMFVKAVSDNSVRNTVEDGYQGIEYALATGADVINLSWSGGLAIDEGKQAMRGITRSNAFVVGSMGNWSQPDPIFPISHPRIFGVTGVDQQGTLIGGNVGVEADIAALSSNVESASTRSNSAVKTDFGASVGTARVSATVALMKLANRNASNMQIKACLKSTALPVDQRNPNFPGLLGAGLLDTRAAVECIKVGRIESGVFKQPEGVLFYSNDKPRKKHLSWQIKPMGPYDGISLLPFIEGNSEKVAISVYAGNKKSSPLWSGLASELPDKWQFRDNDITIELTSKSRKTFRFGVTYAANIIDLSKRYCQGRVEIAQATTISDGSSDQLYANYSDCEWLVLPPKGFNVALTFTSIDTQLHTDVVHLFAGDKRIQKQLLLKLSGDEVPDRLLIKGGYSALLWFVSDGDTVGNGFAVQVEFVPDDATPTVRH